MGIDLSSTPRIAFFPDSYLEIDGAAMTCRRLVAHASDNGWRMLCVHAEGETNELPSGTVTHLPLKRSPLSIPIDESLAFDPFFMRHFGAVLERLREFKPDIIHITGLNDVSILGAFAARKLQTALIASWHTNLHEFAANRLTKTLRFLPKPVVSKIASTAEKWILRGNVLYYRMPKVVLAPNQELVDMLASGTGRSARLMGRGVDTQFFSPKHRTANDGICRLGFAGRLRAEKNLDVLIDIDKALQKAGLTDYEFLIVGDGSERKHLEKNLSRATFTGYLAGDALAEAYANMDLFVFPSESDAFGNVAQEANASGVPAIVSSKGGPKFIVVPGVTGFVATNQADFVDMTVKLVADRERLSSMKVRSREFTLTRSWDSVFAGVHDAYLACIELEAASKVDTNRDAPKDGQPSLEDLSVK